MKKNLCKFSIIILLFTCFFLLIPGAKAVSSFLYLSPPKGGFAVGSTFSVSIYVDTEENSINVVEVDLIFPPDKLQVTSPTAGNSFVSEWLTPPSYSNTRGVISFRGGILGGITTSSGLISTITFRAMAPGKASVKFSEGSRVILHDGKGTEVFPRKLNGEYVIDIPPSEGPDVFSSTHSNPNTWYSDTNPAFAWKKELNVTDYSWSFDQNPKGVPDGISENKESFTSFPDVSDGVWYFHIRQKKQGVWGGTNSIAVKIDTAPPQDFEPKVETYTRLIGHQTVIYFETIDNLSGTDHYEVGIINLSESEAAPSFFTEQLSPYKIPIKKSGKYNAIVRAIDKAGNILEKETRFRIITPFITHIEGKGIEIRGLMLSWWLISFLLFLFLLGLATLILILYKKLLNKRQLE